LTSGQRAQFLRSDAVYDLVFVTRSIGKPIENALVSATSRPLIGGVAGNPSAGAEGAVFDQVARAISNDVPEFRLILRRGGFDLAR